MCALDDKFRRWVKIRTVRECYMCGRMLPVGSKVVRRRIHEEGRLIAIDECPECSEAIEACPKLKKLPWRKKFPVLKVCRDCDSYPWCEHVKGMREGGYGMMWQLIIPEDELITSDTV